MRAKRLWIVAGLAFLVVAVACSSSNVCPGQLTCSNGVCCPNDMPYTCNGKCWSAPSPCGGSYITCGNGSSAPSSPCGQGTVMQNGVCVPAGSSSSGGTSGSSGSSAPPALTIDIDPSKPGCQGQTCASGPTVCTNCPALTPTGGSIRVGEGVAFRNLGSSPYTVLWCLPSSTTPLTTVAPGQTSPAVAIWNSAGQVALKVSTCSGCSDRFVASPCTGGFFVTVN